MGYMIDGGGALLFKADDSDSLLPDSDYLAFGVWTEVPDSPTLANPGRVRPFATGNAGPFDHGDFKDLTGKAEYSGGAVGHWATRAQASHMVYSGRFTAKAEVEASFDAAGVSLSGMVNGFMDETGEMDMSGWLVNLNAGESEMGMVPDPDGGEGAMMAGIPTSEVDILGDTTGYAGSRAWMGVWEAWMFGNNTDTTPTGVAGNFQASSGTAQPVITPEARIDQFNDQGFAGVVGAFAGRQQQ
jgi:hypothetical protein